MWYNEDLHPMTMEVIVNGKAERRKYKTIPDENGGTRREPILIAGEQVLSCINGGPPHIVKVGED